MPEPSPREAPITRIAPLWRALGYQLLPQGRRYFLLVNGQVRRYRACQMYGLNFLLDIYPDREHWRRMFPYGVGRRVDTGEALRFFARACDEAGEYKPAAPTESPAAE